MIKFFGVEIENHDMLNLFEKYSNYYDFEIDDVYDDAIIKDTEHEIKNIVLCGNFYDILNYMSEFKISKENMKKLSRNIIYESMEKFRESADYEGINSNEIIEHFNNGLDDSFFNIRFSDDSKYIYYDTEEKPNSNDADIWNDVLEYTKYKTGKYPIEEYQENTNNIETELIDIKVNSFESTLNSELETFLKDYEHVGTDEKLSLKQKKLGLINTINILQSGVNNFLVKTVQSNYVDCLEMTKEKIRHKETNRLRKLERLSMLITNSNTNLIMQDSNNNVFYPILRDLLYARFKIEDMLKKDESLLALLKQVSYEDKNNVVRLEPNYVALYNFSKEVRINQLWNYIISTFAEKYNSSFDDMSKLIKFFAYKDPSKYTNSLKKPLKRIPLSPIKIHNT